MAELRTELQRRLMACIVVRTREKQVAGDPYTGVTTRELSEMTGRFGQVVGHSCGAMVERGLLRRTALARYGLTKHGIEVAVVELRGYVLERDDG